MLRVLGEQLWYLVGAVWVVLTAAVVWSHRRKTARREEERERRFRDMLSEARLVAAAAAANAAGRPGVQAPVPQSQARPPEFTRKSPLLPKAEALLYYVLRAGLPDHEVFARLALADMVEPAPAVAGYDPVQRLRQLALQRVDFVVCDRSLEVIAAIVIERGGAADAADAENRRILEESLGAAGIRLLRFDPAAPPRHQQVRALVYGETAAAA
jgi:hypothetical protein